LNTIPTLLLEKVEVLTGGASSVYGSDAVAGVVNFVLDDEFVGFKAAYSHGFYNHENDNSSYKNYKKAMAMLMHQAMCKLVILVSSQWHSVATSMVVKVMYTAFLEHTDTKPMLQGEFDISACALSGGTGRCGGSSTIPPGRWADFGGYTSAGFTNIDPSVTRLDLKVEGNNFVPRDGQTYNYNPTNFFQRPDDRINM
jgi:hypothetical protein